MPILRRTVRTGRCSECGKRVKLNRAGAARWHRSLLIGEITLFCPGSGLWPRSPEVNR